MKQNLHDDIQLNGGLGLNILIDDEVNEIHQGTLKLLDQTGVLLQESEVSS